MAQRLVTFVCEGDWSRTAAVDIIEEWRRQVGDGEADLYDDQPFQSDDDGGLPMNAVERASALGAEALERARTLGADHGTRDAEVWWAEYPGLGSRSIFARKVQRDGLESVLGYLPEHSWTGAYTRYTLGRDLGNPLNENLERIPATTAEVDAYESAYRVAVEATIRKATASMERIERDDPLAHSTYDGHVSLCGRPLDRNYSATNKPRCAECEAARP